MTSKRQLLPHHRIRFTAKRAALMVSVCTLSIFSVACSNVSNGSDTQGSAGMFSFLFGKKKAPTTIHPSVGAALLITDKFPAKDSAEIPAISSARCRQVRVEGEFPAIVFRDGKSEFDSSTAFIVEGISARGPMAIVNRQREAIELWELSTTDYKLVKQLPAEIVVENGRWRDFSARQVACLPNSRVLVSLNFRTPALQDALVVYDAMKSTFKFLSRVEINRKTYFEFQAISSDATMVMFATDRVRKSAEVYHNLFNHFVLFNKKHPDGIEVMNLGIDTGSAEQWNVQGKTLFIQTRDRRDTNVQREATWSLDISKLID